jgi:hypothetical protein
MGPMVALPAAGHDSGPKLHKLYCVTLPHTAVYAARRPHYGTRKAEH